MARGHKKGDNEENGGDRVPQNEPTRQNTNTLFEKDETGRRSHHPALNKNMKKSKMGEEIV